jgi:hypothetical protein
VGQQCRSRGSMEGLRKMRCIIYVSVRRKQIIILHIHCKKNMVIAIYLIRYGVAVWANLSNFPPIMMLRVSYRLDADQRTCTPPSPSMKFL